MLERLSKLKLKIGQLQLRRRKAPRTLPWKLLERTYPWSRPQLPDAEVETVLVDAPGGLARDRVRHKTPDRPPATKRTQDDEGVLNTLRRRLDDRMDDDGPADVDSPL